MKSMRPVHQVRQIESRNVVSNDDVGVDLFNKVSPLLEHVCFIVRGDDLSAHDVRAFLEGKYISYKWLRVAYKDVRYIIESGLGTIPCRVTMLAIWMTGSLSASGNMPFRPAHSISKLRMRSGAILDQLPSGA